MASPQSMLGLSRFQYEAAWRCSLWEDQHIRSAVPHFLTPSSHLPHPSHMHFSPQPSSPSLAHTHSMLAQPGGYKGYHRHLCDSLVALRDGETSLLSSSLSSARSTLTHAHKHTHAHAHAHTYTHTHTHKQHTHTQLTSTLKQLTKIISLIWSS